MAARKSGVARPSVKRSNTGRRSACAFAVRPLAAKSGCQSARSAKFQRKRALLSRELQRHSVLCLDTGAFRVEPMQRLGAQAVEIGNKQLLVGFDR